MERDILAQIRHPFIVKLHYGKYLLYIDLLMYIILFIVFFSFPNRRQALFDPRFPSRRRSLHSALQGSHVHGRGCQILLG